MNIINSMLLFKASKEELLKIMSVLKSNKSAGSDGMLSKIVKQCCHELSTPLLTIINRSLKEGIFPDKLKIAKVIPIFKKNTQKKQKITDLQVFLAVSARF